MSWDAVTGDERVLPGGGLGGSQDEIKLESGVAKRVRLILGPNEQPYSYLEHCIEIETIENNQVVKTFRTVRCPKTTKNPNAICPLCDGQQARRRIRHAVNVWDYDQNKIQKLSQGEDVFKPIATTRKLGVDVLNVDWAILKTGEGRNDTSYSATNLGPTAFTLPADAVKFDIEQEYAPHTVDDMRAIVEGAGGNWDSLIVPPQLQYPTLQEALAHQIPNGKHKGKTMEQAWNEDRSNRGIVYFFGMKSDRITDEKACAQVILARLGGISIPGVPMDDSGVAPQQPIQQTEQPQQPIQQQPPVQQQQPVQQTEQPQQPVQQTAQPIDSGRQELIAKINQLLATKEKFAKGGFTVIIETMKKHSNGKTNIVDFTDAELQSMYEECEQA